MSEEKMPVVERRMTPEMKAAMDRFIPISSDPIDHYTPEYFKENFPATQWPVIEIRKPGTLDLMKVMQEVKQVKKEDAPAEGISVPELAAQAIRTWRERVVSFTPLKPLKGEPIAFEADEKGAITDRCLNRIPWNLVMDVHYRYDALFGLTDLEREGLG